MRRWPLVALAVLSLALAADNARLRQRREPPPSAKWTAPPRAEPAPAPAPAAAAPAPEPAPAKAPEIRRVDTPRIQPGVIRSWTVGRREHGLGLGEAQKKLIEELRKTQDAQTRIHHDEIRRIEAQTDLAIRQLLDPEQAKRFDAGVAGVEEFVLASAAAVDVPPGPPSAYLGVSGDDAEGGGATIGQVFDGTAAVAAGLKAGDVVLEFNGQPVPTYAELAARIREAAPHSAAVLKIRRDGAVFQQPLQLGSRP